MNQATCNERARKMCQEAANLEAHNPCIKANTSAIVQESGADYNYVWRTMREERAAAKARKESK